MKFILNVFRDRVPVWNNLAMMSALPPSSQGNQVRFATLFSGRIVTTHGEVSNTAEWTHRQKSRDRQKWKENTLYHTKVDKPCLSQMHITITGNFGLFSIFQFHVKHLSILHCKKNPQFNQSLKRLWQMQRIKIPFLPLMNIQQPSQKPLIQGECMGLRFQLPIFTGWWKDSGKQDNL